MRRAACVLQVEGQAVMEAEALRLWPAFYEAQCSLDGPQTPAALRRRIRGEPVAVESDHPDTLPGLQGSFSGRDRANS